MSNKETDLRMFVSQLDKLFLKLDSFANNNREVKIAVELYNNGKKITDAKTISQNWNKYVLQKYSREFDINEGENILDKMNFFLDKNYEDDLKDAKDASNYFLNLIDNIKPFLKSLDDEKKKDIFTTIQKINKLSIKINN